MNEVLKVDQRLQKKTKSKHGFVNYWKEKSAELREQGITVKIRHDRIFTKKLIVPVFNNRGAATKTRFKEDVVVLTKAQYKFTGQTKEEYLNKEIPKNPTYAGYTIQNYGGCTTVTLFKDNTELGHGVSRVNPIDKFVRLRGLTNAIHNALQDMKSTEISKVLDAEYLQIPKREDN